MSSMLVLLLLTLTSYSASAFSPNAAVALIPSRGVEQRTSPLFHSNSIDRRSTLAASFGIFSALVGTSSLTNGNYNTNNNANAQSMPLFLKVKQLESANYMGQIGRPIYPPNVSGDPEEFMPGVKLNGNEVTVTVGMNDKHVNDEKNFIQFLWLKDVATEEVVLAKELIPTDTNPELKAKVPSGVTLRPYLFSNIHGLWKGEEFTVAGGGGN